VRRLDREVILYGLGIVAGAFALELVLAFLLNSLLPPLSRVGSAMLHAALLAILLSPLVLGILGWQWRTQLNLRRADLAARESRRQLSERAEEAALLWTAVEQLPVTVVVTDARGRIQYVNPAFTLITGYRPEEAIGATPRILKSGVQDRVFYEKLWGTILSGVPWRGEVVNRRKDGAPYVQELIVQPVRDVSGRVGHFIGIGHDVTEQRQAQEALRESAEALLESQRVARLGSYKADIARGTWTCTPVLDEIFGLTPEFRKDVPGWVEIIHPDDREQVARYYARDVLEHGRRFDREYRIIRARDGQVRWVHGLGEVVYDHEGKPQSLIGTIQDITEQKLAQQRLTESEAQFRALSDQSLTGIALIQEGGRLVYVNPRLAEMFGYTPEEMLGLRTVDVVHEDDRAMMRESIRQRLSGEVERVHHFFKGVRKDGTTIDVELFGRSLTYLGQPATLSSLLDITEQRKAETQLRAQERRFRSLIENSAEGIGLIDGDSTAIYLSPAFTRMLRYPVAEWLGRPLLELVHPDDLSEAARALAGGLELPGVPISWQFRFRDAAGTWRWMEGTAVNLITDPAVGGIVVNWREVTERKQAEEALRASERRARTLFDTVHLIVLGLDARGRVDYVNPFFLQLTGYATEEVLGQSWAERFVPERERLEVGQAFVELLEQNLHAYRQSAIVTKAGQERLIAWNNTVLRDAHGRPTGSLSIGEDITEQRRLEAQLRQAQKMEAVGQLTGGIAHDFNNILMAILGYTDFLLPAVQTSPALSEDVREIRKAADRATVLTRQLLAFSRRQVLVPQLLDLNLLVSEMSKMLQRLIGADVELRTHLAEGLGTVRADPGQLEQVIMNLVLNARDAMPAGGSLDIGTGNVDLDRGYVASHPYVTPGRYVTFWVSDSGIGMSQEALSHVFEPFFTTKPQGKGTGLGLATVYGIVKQSGGHITVYSELDKGSTFKIYLPRADEPAPAPAETVEGEAVGGHETVLIVDDDDGVRTLVRRVLDEQGYRVMAANGPAAAREAVQSNGHIDLLITDVVMPGQSGRDLADELVARLPGLKVLYMSGYTQDAIVHRGILDPGIHFVNKPISAEALLRTVRDLLNGPPHG